MLEGGKKSIYNKIKFGPIARKYRERGKALGLISEGGEWRGTVREKAVFLFRLHGELMGGKALSKTPWAELLCFFTYPEGYKHKDLLRDSRNVAKEWRNIENLNEAMLRERFSSVYDVFE